MSGIPWNVILFSLIMLRGSLLLIVLLPSVILYSIILFEAFQLVVVILLGVVLINVVVPDRPGCMCSKICCYYRCNHPNRKVNTITASNKNKLISSFDSSEASVIKLFNSVMNRLVSLSLQPLL
jgi:hypothetical protein